MALILIVDDQDFVRDLLRRVLEGAGHQTLLAGSGEEALALLRTQAVDLMLCDIYLPGGGGLELISTARQEFPGVKILAMSGGSFDREFDALAAARDLGAAAALQKPFTPPALLEAVEAVLRGESTG